MEFPVRECSDRRRPSGSGASPCGAPRKRRSTVLLNWNLLHLPGRGDTQSAITRSITSNRTRRSDCRYRVQPGGRTDQEAMCRVHIAGPVPSPVSQRQVTTATPDGLDFRRTAVPNEGFAGTMPTDSDCSVPQGGMRPQGLEAVTAAMPPASVLGVVGFTVVRVVSPRSAVSARGKSAR